MRDRIIDRENEDSLRRFRVILIDEYKLKQWIIEQAVIDNEDVGYMHGMLSLLREDQAAQRWHKHITDMAALILKAVQLENEDNAG